MKIYGANFFQLGPGGGRPRFLPELLLFDFLLWSENLKGSLKKGK
jgi:hypothetical protein